MGYCICFINPGPYVKLRNAECEFRNRHPRTVPEVHLSFGTRNAILKISSLVPKQKSRERRSLSRLPDPFSPYLKRENRGVFGYAYFVVKLFTSLSVTPPWPSLATTFQ